jgi:hypothetical protein
VNAAQHRLHLTAFGVGTPRYFAKCRAMMSQESCLSRRQVSHIVGQRKSRPVSLVEPRASVSCLILCAMRLAL